MLCAHISPRCWSQDDKKSSIASESHGDEAGGRRDSFESEDMPIEPIENQTAYAKSNIIKGKLILFALSHSTLYPEQILRKGSSLLAHCAQLGPPTLCRQCALSQQNISKGKLRQRKRGPRMPKVHKENLMNSVVELGSVFFSILKASWTPASGEKSKLCGLARCAVNRRIPFQPLWCPGCCVASLEIIWFAMILVAGTHFCSLLFTSCCVEVDGVL